MPESSIDKDSLAWSNSYGPLSVIGYHYGLDQYVFDHTDSVIGL